MKKFEAPELNILPLITEDVTSDFLSALTALVDTDSDNSGWSADK